MVGCFPLFRVTLVLAGDSAKNKFFAVYHLKTLHLWHFDSELLQHHNKYWRLTFGIRVGLAPAPTLPFRSSWRLHSLLFLLYIHICIFAIPVFVRTVCVTIWISVLKMKLFPKQSLYFRDVDLLETKTERDGRSEPPSTGNWPPRRRDGRTIDICEFFTLSSRLVSWSWASTCRNFCTSFSFSFTWSWNGNTG